MTTTTETERHVRRERIARGADAVEARHFLLRYECPLSELEPEQDAIDDLVDRAIIDSGFLEHLCALTEGDQEPTDNWREKLHSL